MSRSTKAYDYVTFLMCANIMGALAAPLFPFALGSFSGAELYSTITGSILVGLVVGLIAAIAISKFIPNAEKGTIYSFFAGTFMALWTSLTSVVDSIQQHIEFTGFNISPLFFGIGIFLLIMSLFAISGADMER